MTTDVVRSSVVRVILECSGQPLLGLLPLADGGVCERAHGRVGELGRLDRLAGLWRASSRLSCHEGSVTSGILPSPMLTVLGQSTTNEVA